MSRRNKERPIKVIRKDGTFVFMTKKEECKWRKATRTRIRNADSLARTTAEKGKV